MDIITVKEYFILVSKWDAEIDNLQSDKEALKVILYSMGVKDYEECAQHSHPSDKFGSLFSRISEKEREIVLAIERLISFRTDVTNRINALRDRRYIQLLHKRYIQYQDFERISDEMGYTYQYIIELHGKALREFSRTYKTLLKDYDKT